MSPHSRWDGASHGLELKVLSFSSVFTSDDCGSIQPTPDTQYCNLDPPLVAKHPVLTVEHPLWCLGRSTILCSWRHPVGLLGTRALCLWEMLDPTCDEIGDCTWEADADNGQVEQICPLSPPPSKKNNKTKMPTHQNMSPVCVKNIALA